jgi:hypothetical protein
MSDGQVQESESNASSARNVSRIAGSVIGISLFALALFVVFRDRATLRDALDAIRSASPLLIITLLAMPVASWSLTSLMYCVLTNRDRDVIRRRHVPISEMHSVLGSAWLLNYLPARPGMVGRMMYHTLVNRIAFTSVLHASLAALACGVVASALLVGVAIVLVLLSPDAPTSLVIATCLLPVLVLGIAAFVVRRRERSRRVLLALLIRYIDVLTWLVRYMCIFAMLGRPVSLFEAAALTAASQAANMIPLVGNGMGVREWASALLAPALPTALPQAASSAVAQSTATTLTQSLALSAELVHRAAELLVALPIGLVSLAIVSRRIAAARAAAKLLR